MLIKNYKPEELLPLLALSIALSLLSLNQLLSLDSKIALVLASVLAIFTCVAVVVGIVQHLRWG